MKKAIVLLSGGLDSTTALHLARHEGFDEIYALTFEYGQKHDREIQAARAIAQAAGVSETRVTQALHRARADVAEARARVAARAAGKGGAA